MREHGKSNSAVRVYGTKVGGIIATVGLVLVLIFCCIVWLVGMSMENSEIHKMIEAQKGIIQTIHKVKLEESPFLLTMESREGRRSSYANHFYKIVYVKAGEQHLAWYRSVLGLFTIKGTTTDFYHKPIDENIENKHLIKTYGDKWIFE